MNSKFDDLKKKYNESVTDDVKFGILLALELNGPLNLKRLSILLGRPETTVIRYIKKLLDEEMIIIDVEKTATDWGKYYTLSGGIWAIIEERKKRDKARSDTLLKELHKLKDGADEDAEDFMKLVLLSKDDIEFSAITSKRYLAIASNTQKMIINNFASAVEAIMKIYRDKGIEYLKENLIIDPSDIEMWNTSIKISSMKQLFELIDLSVKTHRLFEDLKSKFEYEMNEKNIPDEEKREIYLYSFLGSIDFSYRLKDELN